MVPVAMRAMSRILPIRSDMRPASSRMARLKSRRSSASRQASRSTRIPAAPMIRVSGVRRSWDMALNRELRKASRFSLEGRFPGLRGQPDPHQRLADLIQKCVQECRDFPAGQVRHRCRLYCQDAYHALRSFKRKIGGGVFDRYVGVIPNGRLFAIEQPLGSA